jgi:hypothetical protein
MLPSLHDHFLVSCEVNCETRKIKLYAKRDPRIPATSGEQTIRVVVFNGVEGYQFENDPFGNIIVSSQAIPAAEVMPPHRERPGFLDRDQAPRTRGVQC